MKRLSPRSGTKPVRPFQWKFTRADRLIREYVLPLNELGTVLPLLGAAIILVATWATARVRGRVPEVVETIEDPEKRVQALITGNDYEAAAQIRMDQGEFDKALSLYQNSGNPNKVALCHLALKQPAQAAAVFRTMGRHAEAAHYFQSADMWLEAAGCLESIGSRREAAELFERAGEYGRAAHHLRRLGDAENAARLFELAGLGAEAAEALLAAHGREPRILLRAAGLFERGEDPRRAAECYAGAAQWMRAAELFEEVQEYALAAQAYEHAEAWAQAGSAYVLAGAYREARANFERAGRIVGGMGLYSNMEIPGRGKLSNAPAGWPDVLQSGSLNVFIEIYPEGFRPPVGRSEGAYRLDNQSLPCAFMIPGDQITNNELPYQGGPSPAQVWRAQLEVLDRGLSID